MATFSVRLGEDHVGRISGSPILDTILPHIGVIVLQGVNEDGLAKLQTAAALIKEVAVLAGNQAGADNFVCEKR